MPFFTGLLTKVFAFQRWFPSQHSRYLTASLVQHTAVNTKSFSISVSQNEPHANVSRNTVSCHCIVSFRALAFRKRNYLTPLNTFYSRSVAVSVSCTELMSHDFDRKTPDHRISIGNYGLECAALRVWALLRRKQKKFLNVTSTGWSASSLLLFLLSPCRLHVWFTSWCRKFPGERVSHAQTS